MELSLTYISLNSRLALKKYILANNKNVTPGATFDGQFNRAVKAGADKEEFALPKGTSLCVQHLYPTTQASCFAILLSGYSCRAIVTTISRNVSPSSRLILPFCFHRTQEIIWLTAFKAPRVLSS